ncbi:MAG TPA: hypothetical protein VGE01_11175 [Fimbriimonas sp.]
MPRAAAPVGTAATMGAFDAQRKRNTILLVTLAILALVGAIVTGLALSGVLKFGAKAPDHKTLQARGQAPRGVLEARGTAAPPVMPQVAQKVEMPKEIEDWLNHLKRCEELKRELTVQQNGELSGLLMGAGIGALTPQAVDIISGADADINDALPTRQIADKLVPMITRWTDLDDAFRKYPPPPECQQLATAFDSGLNGLASQMDAIRSMLAGLDANDPNMQSKGEKTKADAQHVLRTHTRSADDNFQMSQRLLEEICDKYNRKPWFNIDSKGSVGGLLGGTG